MRVNKQLPLDKDGDSITYIQGILNKKRMVFGQGGHMPLTIFVNDGRVRWEEKDGIAAADKVANLARRRKPEDVSDARRRSQNACSCWYSIMCDLHRFFIAVARTVVKQRRQGRYCP